MALLPQKVLTPGIINSSLKFFKQTLLVTDNLENLKNVEIQKNIFI